MSSAKCRYKDGYHIWSLKKLHQFHVVNKWCDVGHSALRPGDDDEWHLETFFSWCPNCKKKLFLQHFYTFRLLYMTIPVTWPKLRSGFLFRKWRMRFLSIYWAIKAQIWSIWTGAKERIHTHCVLKLITEWNNIFTKLQKWLFIELWRKTNGCYYSILGRHLTLTQWVSPLTGVCMNNDERKLKCKAIGYQEKRGKKDK